MRYQGFIWAGLLVADFEGAISFYHDVLGLPLVERGEGYALLDAGNGGLFELWPTGSASSAPKTPEQQSLSVAFWVDDLDGAISELTVKGVQFIGEIGGYAGTRWVSFADPEGNCLSLKEVPQ